MNLLPLGSCDPDSLNALTLAFLGDGVFDLLVRTQLVQSCDYPAGKLHQMAVRQVCCQAQAKQMQQILPMLSEQELAVYKRGRNAHTNHTPKNATNAEYHAATGCEALFGYLYLKGEMDRLKELFARMMPTVE